MANEKIQEYLESKHEKNTAYGISVALKKSGILRDCAICGKAFDIVDFNYRVNNAPVCDHCAEGTVLASAAISGVFPEIVFGALEEAFLYNTPHDEVPDDGDESSESDN